MVLPGTIIWCAGPPRWCCLTPCSGASGHSDGAARHDSLVRRATDGAARHHALVRRATDGAARHHALVRRATQMVLPDTMLWCVGPL